MIATLVSAKPGVLPLAAAPFASAAVVAPYASTYNAHVINHAVSAPVLAAPPAPLAVAPVARTVLPASAPLVAGYSPYYAAPAPVVAARAAFPAVAPAIASPYYASALWCSICHLNDDDELTLFLSAVRFTKPCHYLF